MPDATYRVAFDIGGTFTDFALLDAETGEIEIHKCLTTPQDPSEGVLQGLAELLERTQVPAGRVENAIHGTTLVTNAIIERKGAKVALLATKGFRDSLDIRNAQRYDIYDLFLRFPEPLVPRYLRIGVDERVDRNGRVLKRVEREAIVEALDRLRAEDAKDRSFAAANGRLAPGATAPGELTSLAICFLHSYRNPENEQIAADLVRECWPELDVSISSEVAPEIREYERTSTTVANAYVRPLTRRYLENLARALAQLGYRGRLYLMLSSGGISTLETAAALPVRLVESGPAGGAIGAAFYGQTCGASDLVSFDMGGTTAKISVIQDGRPASTRQIEVARVHRFKKGSGIPIQFAAVEMAEIGAGGGSIAAIDDMGLLKVGPRSAGADPGPACYGRGGTEPTVTDADLILGYLDPDYFLGGKMHLDRAAAERAIVERVARPLGLTLTESAWGIHQLVNEHMAAAAKIHVIERGQDPRRFSLLAFGGAGPIHAAGVAQALGQQRIICPLAAGVLSAIGFLAAPVAFEFAQSRPQVLQAADWPAVNAMLDDLEERGRAVLREAGVAPEHVEIERTVDARFVGQLHEITVEIPGGALGPASQASIEERFNGKYQALYGHLHDGFPIQIMTWRIVARGQLAGVRLKEHSGWLGDVASARRGERPAYWSELGRYEQTPVYDRYALAPGATVDGPAIVEERESTALIPPHSIGRVDGFLNLIVDRLAPAGAELSGEIRVEAQR
ncbi:MAG: hydantoinase/oxoprolinase family protein [Chloroflexi bacterium]|nr:hydantoinase/oxoprolinase family protein [Chloroflexota bacterium]